MGLMKGRADSRVAMRRQIFSRLEPNSFVVMFSLVAPHGTAFNKYASCTGGCTCSHNQLIHPRELKILTSYRLGKPKSATRPLKIILEDRTQRKCLIDNAKFIPKKAPQPLRDVIITKDLTPLQQAEKESLLKKVKKPKQIADSAGAGALSMVVEIQKPAISPILSQDQLSQTNVFDDSRPLESTRLMASHFLKETQ